MVNATKNLQGRDHRDVVPQRAAGPGQRLRPPDAAALDPELKKLKRDVPVYLYGGKPKHLKIMRAQVKALKRKKLQMLVQGKTYQF